VDQSSSLREIATQLAARGHLNQAIVDAKVPKDIRDKYEIISYLNAAVICAKHGRPNTPNSCRRSDHHRVTFPA